MSGRPPIGITEQIIRASPSWLNARWDPFEACAPAGLDARAHLDHHGQVRGPGRPYDQDDPPSPPGKPPEPAKLRARPKGGLFDQDTVGGPRSSKAAPAGQPNPTSPAKPKPAVTARPRPAANARPRPAVNAVNGLVPKPAVAAPPTSASSRPKPDDAPGRPRRSGGSVAAPSAGRSTAVLAAGTLASRLTGFARVLAIGYVLGVSPLSDAFNYANGIPNIIYDLVLGGILAATLIPVFVEDLSSGDPKERSHSVSAVLTALSVGLVAASALLWVLAPYVIDFYLVLEHGSAAGAEKAIATRLLRYFAPQVFFLGTTVASTAILNARRRFGVAAFSPVLNNAIAIAALIATKVVAGSVLAPARIASTATLEAFGRDSRGILVLGAGTTLGYAVQLAAQIPSMHRLGLKLRPVWDPRHRSVRRVAALSGWIVGVVVTNQASLALVLILAGRSSGGVTAYQFAYQFFQLPNALIAVSVASAIMPELARQWTSGALARFERHFVTGLRVTMAVIFPLCVVYLAVAQPLVTLAIHHGAVSGSGARLVSSTLEAFIVGLPGFAAFFLLMRVYQAMQDARGMFRIYLVENTLTVVAAYGLNLAFGVPGLAFAWVLPYSVAAVWAVVDLKGRAGSFGGWLTIRALLRIAVASALAGAGALAVGVAFAHATTDPLLAARVIAQVVAASAIYVYVGTKLRVRELRLALGALRRFGVAIPGG